jgi:hypothetical protein
MKCDIPYWLIMTKCSDVMNDGNEKSIPLLFRAHRRHYRLGWLHPAQTGVPLTLGPASLNAVLQQRAGQLLCRESLYLSVYVPVHLQ